MHEWPTQQEQDESWILDVLGWRSVFSGELTRRYYGHSGG